MLALESVELSMHNDDVESDDMSFMIQFESVFP